MSRQPAPPWSPWSLVGLACSVGLCPVVTMLGVVFGILALRDTRGGRKRGRRVAIAAIIIGLIVTPTTTFALAWWNAMVREPMLQGPLDAIQAGQAGDIQAFLGGFTEKAGTGPQAVQFLQEMGDRFGTLVSIEQDMDREAVWSPVGWAISVPYVLKFTRESVPGVARFVILDSQEGKQDLVFRFAWVRIGETSPLAFPPGAGSEAGTQTGVQDAQ
ncbi:MAG: hypothetical protein P8M22_09930 [Phycisphaerales bacterium]|nr:hypothetical protein [Phycisphaerales bacterium]